MEREGLGDTQRVNTREAVAESNALVFIPQTDRIGKGFKIPHRTPPSMCLPSGLPPLYFNTENDQITGGGNGLGMRLDNEMMFSKTTSITVPLCHYKQRSGRHKKQLQKILKCFRNLQTQHSLEEAFHFYGRAFRFAAQLHQKCTFGKTL